MILARVETATGARRRGLPRGARLIDLPVHSDMRGALVAGEMGDVLPFVPQRYFVVFDVPSRHVRGEHAHRECAQFLTCLAGSLAVHLDDGERRAEVQLDTPGRGLLIPPMVWASQFRYSADAVLLVLASHPYRADDYDPRLRGVPVRACPRPHRAPRRSDPANGPGQDVQPSRIRHTWRSHDQSASAVAVGSADPIPKRGPSRSRVRAASSWRGRAGYPPIIETFLERTRVGIFAGAVLPLQSGLHYGVPISSALRTATCVPPPIEYEGIHLSVRLLGDAADVIEL